MGESEPQIYRVSLTKYDPMLRNESGHYIGEEWISYSDIGESFGNQVLTRQGYMSVEDQYVEQVLGVVAYFGNNRVDIAHLFTVSDLGDFKRHKDEDLYSSFLKVQKASVLTDIEAIEMAIRLRLREYISELELLVDPATNTSIMFGFDYYMYLQSENNLDELLSNVKVKGIFPY